MERRAGERPYILYFEGFDWVEDTCMIMTFTWLAGLIHAFPT